MIDSDNEMRQDEAERDNLQRAVSQAEAALAASAPASRSVLDRFVENAKGRIGMLEKKIKDGRMEREARARDEVALARMAQMETRLNGEEKEKFSGFLAKDFFTKNDFGNLEQFYSQTWDRLSEPGKRAMSERIWEGIRREEYTFSELPETVRKKEMERAYGALAVHSPYAPESAMIPEKDRSDFIQAYERGDSKVAAGILDRPSFSAAMFRSEEAAPVKNVEASLDRKTERAVIQKSKADGGNPVETPRSPDENSFGRIDLGGLKLSGVKPVDGNTAGGPLVAAEPKSGRER